MGCSTGKRIFSKAPEDSLQTRSRKGGNIPIDTVINEFYEQPALRMPRNTHHSGAFSCQESFSPHVNRRTGCRPNVVEAGGDLIAIIVRARTGRLNGSDRAVETKDDLMGERFANRMRGRSRS